MEIFYELLQIALGQRHLLSRILSDEDWTKMYAISQKQTLSGVVYLALEKLSTLGQLPPKALLYEWICLNQQLIINNCLLNKKCVEVTEFFKSGGFRTCILKGQGNALLYPVPESRLSGDIDIWVEGRKETIKKYVMSKYPDAKDGPMHISFLIKDGVEVEAHYIARRTYIPKYNKRLQDWIKDRSNEQFSNYVSLQGEADKEICVPTVSFNVVYQMSHIMGLFFVEGVGLRHIVDYFYVLKKLHESASDEDFEFLFRYLGLLRFARGVMWIEKMALGLDNEYLICQPDEKIGRVILKEIEKGGNFGQYDERYAYRRKGYLARGIVDGYRLLNLAYYFPQDSIWKIVRKVENQMWKIKNSCY